MGITRLHVRNFRLLADVTLEPGDVTVIFGPNGAGKTTLLDTLWFVRDCAIRGVEFASSSRSHGIGMLYDGASPTDTIVVETATSETTYELSIALSAGRIEPFPGERLHSAAIGRNLIERDVGSNQARFWNTGAEESFSFTLREPDKLSLGRYLDFDARASDAVRLDQMLRSTQRLDSRSFNLFGLRQFGSEADHRTRLFDRADNLWSVLRNLQGRSGADERYSTIVGYMREALPDAFEEVLLEPTAPNVVYGSFVQKGRRKPVLASGVADGHMQLLIVLTALFSDSRERTSTLLFDEPDLSLHPWAIAVLAKAIREACRNWNRQVILCTHSPVMMSQFEPSNIYASQADDTGAHLTRLSDIVEITHLLEEYSAGSLYMAQLVAPQAPEEGVPVGGAS